MVSVGVLDGWSSKIERILGGERGLDVGKNQNLKEEKLDWNAGRVLGVEREPN